jgi:hypothetical protein
MNITIWGLCTRDVCKVHVLTLVLRVGTLWRCSDGLFFKVPPLASYVILTTLHSLLKNVLQIVCRNLQEDNGTGGFYFKAPFSWLEKPKNRMGRDPDCMVDVVMGFHRSRGAHAPLRLLRRPKMDSFKTTVTPFSRSGWNVVRSASLAKGGTSKRRPSPHLRKVPTRSSKMSPRTLQTTLVHSSSVIWISP